MLYAKTIMDKPVESDGYRILVMHGWPSTFPASWAEGFNPKLAPSQNIYNELIEKKIMFEEFSSKYLAELDAQKERLTSLKKQAEKFSVTLVTYQNFEGKSVGQIIIDKCGSI